MNHSCIRLRGVLACALLAACSSGSVSSSNTRPGETGAREPPVQAASSAPYANGSWWKEPSELNGRLVSLAHILVTHQDAKAEYWFSRWPWKDAPPASKRSRAQAKALADQLYARLARDPSLFASLAKTSSDDTLSSPFGGEIGVVIAANIPMELLDGYAAVPVGTVTRPMESLAGYHLVKRLPVMPPRSYRYKQIVIAHAGSSCWLRPGRDGTRSREDASALARDIHAKLAEDPTRFDALLREYSDDLSATLDDPVSVGMDRFGSNTFDILQTLERLAVGGISEVLPEPRGLVILQRAPDQEQEPRAFDYLLIGSNTSPRVPPRYRPPRTEAEAKELAETLIRKARAEPESFPELQAQYCQPGFCQRGSRALTNGADHPGTYRRLSEVNVGEVAPEPDWTPVGYMVARRVASPPSHELAPLSFLGE